MDNLAVLTEPVDPMSKEETGAAPLAQRRSVFREVRWRWSIVLLGLAPIVLRRTVRALDVPVPLVPGGPWVNFLTALLEEGWTFVFPLWVARHVVARLSPRPQLRITPAKALLALLGIGGIFLSQAVVLQLLDRANGAPPQPTVTLESLSRLPNRVEFLHLLFMAILVAPVAEEVFFRGMLYNALRQRLPTLVAVPLQAIVFGLIHEFGPAGVAFVVIGGVALALVYEWRKTIVAPILLHTAVNGVGMAFIAWSYVAEAAAPHLGVYGSTNAAGCQITKVVPGTPADKAGLRFGDVISSLGGKAVVDLPSLTKAVRGKQVGEKVVVEFIREGTVHRVDVVLQRLQE
jgi:membrane protease YdiL (CAAX protease family)